jgi:alkylation response protein AidB-like acyl-CoA dehydrogenase
MATENTATILAHQSIVSEGADTVENGPLTPEVQQVERTMPGHAYGRDNLREWVRLRERNAYTRNKNFRHTMRFYLGDEFSPVDTELTAFGTQVPTTLDAAVTENDLRFNNPRIDPYNYIGDRVDEVVHHPAYTTGGDIIYGTGIVKKMATLGTLCDGMAFYYLSNHVGEAGHHCPVVCNYETARVLRLVDDFPGRDDYIAKLEEPSYSDNFTSSQFLTEVQGGSDVGANDTRAWQDEQGNWFIRGEKWFCSNANAELMVISARRSMDRKGTKGLSMFLIPSTKPDGSRNNYTMRRLKEKLGTRALASAEMDYHDAYAIPLGDNFNFMLEKVIHHSRITLAVAVLGMTNRAYQLAYDFASTRHAFGKNIMQYPLVKENLAHVKVDVMATLAGTFSLVSIQDRVDTSAIEDKDVITFSRLMVNIGKSVASKRAVDNIHHCIDGIGGNAAIENTSSMPRLLRDAVILENWEGTHNTLYMQVLRDIHRYQHDQVYCKMIESYIADIAQAHAEEKSLAGKALAALQALLGDFHQAEADLQTLKMQDIVTQMANLFYYVALVLEGVDQLQTEGSDNKLQCASLFYRDCLNEQKLVRDAQYLDLCTRVLDLDNG